MGRFRIGRLDHVNITVPEELENEVLDWYENVLGLERITKPEGTRARGGWFALDSSELHVSVDPHNPPQTAHYGVIVDDIGAVVEELRAAGCHIEQAGEIPGRKRFYTRDPAGNRLEIASVEGD